MMVACESRYSDLRAPVCVVVKDGHGFHIFTCQHPQYRGIVVRRRSTRRLGLLKLTMYASRPHYIFQALPSPYAVREFKTQEAKQRGRSVTESTKTIVCLANSRKNGGRCVAGREWNDGQPGDWIRPISERPGEELQKSWLYSYGGDPTPLDIVRMPLIEPRATEYQPENWLFDPEAVWRKCGSVGWDELHKMADPIADLWSIGLSSKHGKNDIIRPAKKFDSTLRLVRVQGLQISVSWDWVGRGKRQRQVRANFMYHNQEYGLKVTDAHFEREFKKKGDGEYEIGECYITISIVGPYANGNRFGLIAAIIKP